MNLQNKIKILRGKIYRKEIVLFIYFIQSPNLINFIYLFLMLVDINYRLNQFLMTVHSFHIFREGNESIII